jgi:hypothetical protein
LRTLLELIAAIIDPLFSFFISPLGEGTITCNRFAGVVNQEQQVGKRHWRLKDENWTDIKKCFFIEKKWKVVLLSAVFGKIYK